MPPTSRNALRRVDTLTRDQIDSYLASYPAALIAKASSSTSKSTLSGETLAELDQWYQALPFLTTTTSISDSISTKTDLIKLVKWKLSREKHRPTLISLISSNPAPICQQVLLRASTHLVTHSKHRSLQTSPTEELLKVVEETMKILAELKGVGPATSSAIVASWIPWGVFQSDELVLNLNAGQGKIDYTWAFYRRFYGEAIEVVKKSMRDGKGLICGKDVERVAWSMFHGPSAPDSLENVQGEDRTSGKVNDKTANKKIREKVETLGKKEVKRKTPESMPKANPTDEDMQARRTSKRIRSKS
ncbi:uncharacterized protein UTRI_05028_B [Ustilago trichophora]|uniref:Uncharacterized protein n=1 Tax=Ustilago trichophora TaxID=86804 RepID=A0A5C3EGR0_9BASI|nr:uncharacterized protein UTRI_05028_B [Ustilago trichophora]